MAERAHVSGIGWFGYIPTCFLCAPHALRHPPRDKRLFTARKLLWLWGQLGVLPPFSVSTISVERLPGRHGNGFHI